MTSDSRSETYGIGEWYGNLFTELTVEERQHFAEVQDMRTSERPDIPCPFQSHGNETVRCTKAGGVCSLRKYAETDEGAKPLSGLEGGLCATCPYRFEEDDLVYRWVGSELLDSPSPIVREGIDFLEYHAGNNVGTIDGILLAPQMERLMDWCALEKQYLCFPVDDKAQSSSGPQQLDPSEPLSAIVWRDAFAEGARRLMARLQVKASILRRWGKRVAVVVDTAFWEALLPVKAERDVSLGAVVWFVVDYDDSGGSFGLVRGATVTTTLENAVAALAGGRPVSKSAFETQLRSMA
jgi:hypothetical protein